MAEAGEEGPLQADKAAIDSVPEITDGAMAVHGSGCSHDSVLVQRAAVE